METEETEKVEQKEANQEVSQNANQESVQNTSQEAYQNTNQEEVTATAIVKKSKAKLITLICIIVILIAGGAAGYIYYMQINKPINKFAKLSNQFFNTMVSQFSSEDSGVNDKLAAILNGKFSANMKLSANISDLNLNDMLSALGSVDSNSASELDNIKNQVGNYEVNLTYEKDKQNKEQLININYTDKSAGQTYNPYKVFNSGDNYGLSFPEVYNKIITFTKTDLTNNEMEDVATAFDSMLNMDYSTTFANKTTTNWFTSDEINTILNNLQPIYNKYFTDDKFTEQKNINENKDSEITLTMTEADFGNFLKDTLSVLKDNEDVKKIIANKLGLTDDYTTYDSTLSDMIDGSLPSDSESSKNITLQLTYNGDTIKAITFTVPGGDNDSNGSITITQPETGAIDITIQDGIGDGIGVTLNKNSDNDYTISYKRYDSENNRMNMSLGIKWVSQIVNNSTVNIAYTITPSYSYESSDGNMSFAGQLNANMIFAPIDKVEIPDTSTNSASLFDENTQTDFINAISDLAINNPDELMKKMPILANSYIAMAQLGRILEQAQNAQDSYDNSTNEEDNYINKAQQTINDILNNLDNNSIDENY